MTELFPPEEEEQDAIDVVLTTTTTTPSSPTNNNNNTISTSDNGTADAVVVMVASDNRNDPSSSSLDTNKNSSGTLLLNNLPRSVRWRIQLGLLEMIGNPTDYNDNNDALVGTLLLDNIYQTNQTLIEQQNHRFQELMDKYVTTEEDDDDDVDVVVEEESESKLPSSKKNKEGGEDDVLAKKSSSSQQQPMLDPLTAMVMEQEQQETRKQELYLKYRKERARRKRGLTSELSSNHHPNNHEDGENNVDDDGIDRASLNIIEKDLKRLPHPFETTRSQTHHHSSSPANTAAATTTPSTPPPPQPINQEVRIGNLREILYIYSQEHPTMGYRQGMHEIASFLLLVLELDTIQYPNHPLIRMTTSPPPTTTSSTSSSSSSSVLPYAYALLETTLEQLQIAYDASVDQSLQHMSLSILTKLYQNDPTLHLHLTTSPNIPPPPIYCTRWVRLLFSREVIGYENVLSLWDIFMEEQNKPQLSHQLVPQLPLVSNNPNNNNINDSGTSTPKQQQKVQLMHVLELTAASRILLLRNELLNPENNPLDLLMNIPPLSDITPLATTLRQLLQQGDLDEPIQVPASQLLPSLSSSSEMMTPSRQQQQQQQQTQQQLLYQTASQQKSMSLKAWRQSLGQKSESLKNKIINTTNEWKTTMQQQRDMNNINNNMGISLPGGGGGAPGTPGGGGPGGGGISGSSRGSGMGINMSLSMGGIRTPSLTTDMAAAASAALRNHQKVFQTANQHQEPQTVLFADPLLHHQTPSTQQQQNQTTPQRQPQLHQHQSTPYPMQSYPNQPMAAGAVGGSPSASSSSAAMVAQMQQQQTQWAQDMQRHIWTVQQFLMLVEQQKSMGAEAAAAEAAAATSSPGDGTTMTTTTTSNNMADVVAGVGGMNLAILGVPQDVWEAVADLDRIHHDLQNSAMGGEQLW